MFSSPAGTVQHVDVIDSHTGGEPTRVVVLGGPELGQGTLEQRRQVFSAEHNDFRAALVSEPHGSEIMVGALLCPPCDKSCVTGAIFFNNVGTLGMCGHGTIGVAVTLGHLGRISPGNHQLETPVGRVGVRLHEDGCHATFENVPSYRHRNDVVIRVPEFGEVIGDIAWGGNWFFLVKRQFPQIRPALVPELTRYAAAIRSALIDNGITGRGGEIIDHIELFGATDTADSRNFVLCPGGMWDRSPCGTGTSAKIACLAAEGRLQPGEIWRQESTVGSVFDASYRLDAAGQIIPSLTGSAWVTAEARLIFDNRDPFCRGLPA